MLGKCLWKMHTSGAEDPVGKQVPSAESVIQAFLNAIECLPIKKEKNREPIIEPHYKLASLMHKLVQRREIEVSFNALIANVNEPYSPLKPIRLYNHPHMLLKYLPSIS